MRNPESNPIHAALGFIKNRKTDLLLLGASSLLTSLGFRFLPDVQNWRDSIEKETGTRITSTCDNLITQTEERYELYTPNIRGSYQSFCEETLWGQVEFDYDHSPFTQPHRLASAGYAIFLLAAAGATLWKVNSLAQPVLRSIPNPLRLIRKRI